MTAAADKKASETKAKADAAVASAKEKAAAKAEAQKAEDTATTPDNSESYEATVNDAVNERAGKTDHTHVDEPYQEPTEEELAEKEAVEAAAQRDANYHLGASSIDVPDEAKVPEVGWAPVDANDSFNALWVEMNEELDDGAAKDQILNAFTTVQTRFREVQQEHKARREAKKASEES